MANSVARTTRNVQAYSPLPDDVLPNIMLRVEDRQDFKRLACTCHGFYAWSEPWLKSRRQAAELRGDHQWPVKLPAWIKTHTQHLHPADWKALQGWAPDMQDLENSVVLKAPSYTTASKAHSPMRGYVPANQIEPINFFHLDFILFSPRLLADVNPEASREANARLAVNADRALVEFKPTGEAWQYDVLAGATGWLGKNTATMTVQARSMLFDDLKMAMKSVMVAQRSPALVLQLLGQGLAKSHHVENGKTSHMQWREPMLSALIQSWYNCRPKAGSSEAFDFISAIHRIVTTLAQLNENLTLSPLAGTLALMSTELTPEQTWRPGSPGTASLQSLVQAVRNVPAALAAVRETLFQQHFITESEWEQLLLATHDK
nr:hypothetical protein [uncultured Noviherbaspirillum sp.]